MLLLNNGKNPEWSVAPIFIGISLRSTRDDHPPLVCGAGCVNLPSGRQVSLVSKMYLLYLIGIE
jgi:hypothetical protein